MSKRKERRQAQREAMQKMLMFQYGVNSLNEDGHIDRAVEKLKAAAKNKHTVNLTGKQAAGLLFLMNMFTAAHNTWRAAFGHTRIGRALIVWEDREPEIPTVEAPDHTEPDTTDGQ